MNKGKQVAALGAFARAQREENRRRLIAAARRVFERSGYLAPSVDDIAQEAGVSRQTFYRHFDGKLAVAMEFFDEQHQLARKVWGQLSAEKARDPQGVRAWLNKMLDGYEQDRNALRAFFEMGAVEPTFTKAVKDLVRDYMAELTANIPLFRYEQDGTAQDRERFADAVLLVELILEQFNSYIIHYALLERNDMLDALTRSFSRFVARYP